MLSKSSGSEPFQSTLPLRGATVPGDAQHAGIEISIHTPLAGSDFVDSQQGSQMQFQSTLPLRGATAEMRHF